MEYVKEAGSWYLRVYIDKETGVSIDDCEAVSRVLSDLLDEADPIQDPYTLKSLPPARTGPEKPEHFQAYLGAQVDVSFTRQKTGRRPAQASWPAMRMARSPNHGGGHRHFPQAGDRFRPFARWLLTFY
ncbi:MAG: hypothetical protein ACLUFL_03500 [Flavonifractor plautii]